MDELNREETNDDPVIPHSMWQPALWEFFLSSAEEDSEVYNLPAIEREDSEIFEQIAEQVLILEQLGDARQSEIERSYRRLIGLFEQWRWRRKGCAEEELILDEHGDVIGVLLHERHFVGPQKAAYLALG
jgi:hypothetical protein